MRRHPLTISLLSALALTVLVVGLSPLIALCLPDPWKQHAYHEISFQFIARNRLTASRVPEDVVRDAMKYTRRHLWLVDGRTPYAGKSFDYLIEGIGWCDYHAKVFCKLLAARGIHARYDFLRDRRRDSPHTMAEVYLHGKWRAADPFFNLVYAKPDGEWATLEELTPQLVAGLPDLMQLRNATSGLDDQILALAEKTFPLPYPPQRSDDFVQDKNIFDAVDEAYVRLLGKPFAYWYQDRVVRDKVMTLADPVERLWYQVRNYHLYGRFEEAEALYNQLVTVASATPYHERTTLFLSRLLMRQKRLVEAKHLLAQFLHDMPEARWAHLQLAFCQERLGETADAIEHFRRYQELGGRKWSLEAVQHLERLESAVQKAS